MCLFGAALGAHLTAPSVGRPGSFPNNLAVGSDELRQGYLASAPFKGERGGATRSGYMWPPTGSNCSLTAEPPAFCILRLHSHSAVETRIVAK